MATRKYEVRSTRIPLDLAARMHKVVGDGGRYKSIAQFIEMAVRRLVTFEEGEMERKQQEAVRRASTGVDESQSQ